MIRLLLTTALLFSNPAVFGSGVYFSSTHVIEKEIKRALDNTRTRIDVAVFHITNKPLLKTLAEKADKGVHIRILTDLDKYHAARFAMLRHARIEVRVLRGKISGKRGLMHHKFAILDDTTVLSGSANWTAGSTHANYDNFIRLEDPSVVAAFREEFARLWVKAQQVS